MKKFFSILFLLIVILFFLYKHVWTVNLASPVEISIKKGTSLKDISILLEQKSVIKDWRVFYLYSLLRGKNIKYGFYQFSGTVSVHDLWNTLYKGKEKLISVTIIPGNDLLDIAEKLSNKHIVKKEKFLKFVFDEKNPEKFGVEGKTFEGYFPPNTYFFRKNSSVEEIVNLFLDQFKKDYLPYKKFFKEKGLSFYEGMIIASLVEKETFIEEEKPIIAGVILNRLKKVMHLQIDPTVIYALKLSGKWDGNLDKNDMKIDSPYNTYIKYGLPPTPISNFSISSLRSVLNYKKTDYLYYVFDGKKHLFSKNYEDHLKNIKKILAKRKKKQSTNR